MPFKVYFLINLELGIRIPIRLFYNCGNICAVAQLRLFKLKPLTRGISRRGAEEKGSEFRQRANSLKTRFNWDLRKQDQEFLSTFRNCVKSFTIGWSWTH